MRNSQRKVLCWKNPRNIFIINDDNIFTSKLVKTKVNSKYLILYLDNAIRPLILKMSKMSWYAKTFKVRGGDKDKNNKVMLFRIDDEKLLETYKSSWTKIVDLKNIRLNALPA